MKVTAHEIAQMVADKPDGHRIPCHNCIMCDYPCGYIVHPNGIVYDHGCDCTKRYLTSDRTFDDIADWVNMQSREDIALRIIADIKGEAHQPQAAE